MNFPEERYVRLYTRDTPGWLAMPWQARAVAPLLLRKLDRSGTLDIDDEDIDAVIAAVIGLPVDVVKVGLAALVRRNTVSIAGGVLVWPKFLEAQEAVASDKLRARLSRERRRDRAIAVTLRDASSRDVTARDVGDADRDETSLRTVPCSAEPNRAVQGVRGGDQPATQTEQARGES